MNVQQLKKQVGTNLRLIPLPIRIGPDGKRLPDADDPWRVDAILERPSRVRLVNVPTGHTIELQNDNVREYRSPDYLLLRCRLRIEGRTVTPVPILNPEPGEAGMTVRLGQRDRWYGSTDLVVIENEGPGEARQVTLEFLGGNCPVPASELQEKLPVPVMHPHTDIKLMAAISKDFHPPFDVVVRWVDAGGNQRQKQFRLT